MLNRILTTAAFTLTSLTGSLAHADGHDGVTYEVAFDTNAVILHCRAPEGEQISSKAFSEAFPEWITGLQVHANEGRVIRAHYLNELKQGIFVVITGATAEEARANADAINAENEEILKTAMKDAGEDPSTYNAGDACELIEIGPVAILPN